MILLPLARPTARPNKLNTRNMLPWWQMICMAHSTLTTSPTACTAGPQPQKCHQENKENVLQPGSNPIAQCTVAAHCPAMTVPMSKCNTCHAARRCPYHRALPAKNRPASFERTYRVTQSYCMTVILGPSTVQCSCSTRREQHSNGGTHAVVTTHCQCDGVRLLLPPPIAALSC